MGQDKLSARMVLCSQTGEILREYQLDKSEITIGRGSMRDIALPQDRLISRIHATVRYTNGNYILRDEGSANGTLLNGKLIEAMKSYILNNSDQIHLGRLLLVFHTTEDVADLPTVHQTYTPLERKLLRLDEQELAAFKNHQPKPVQLQPVLPDIPPTQQPVLPDSQSTRQQLALSSMSLRSATGPSAVLPAARLRFTIFYPQAAAAGSWYASLVYAHHENATASIYKDATLYQEDAGEVLRREPEAFSQILRSLPITVIPECPGVTFNPWRLTFRWQEEWHRLELRLAPRHEMINKTVQGTIHVFVGPLLVARLRMEVAVKQPDIEVISSDKDVSCAFYKQPFISYSRNDVAFRQACLRASRVLGNSEFVNIEEERSGSRLRDQVRSAIDSADAFQLCWSARAASTDYVAREWSYALQNGKGSDFVCPVYWDVPHPPLPEQLAPRRFVYLPAYTFNIGP